MHRNSVRNILNCYYSQASPELKSIIENNISLKSLDIQKYCDFFLNFKKEGAGRWSREIPQSLKYKFIF